MLPSWRFGSGPSDLWLEWKALDRKDCHFLPQGDVLEHRKTAEKICWHPFREAKYQANDRAKQFPEIFPTQIVEANLKDEQCNISASCTTSPPPPLQQHRGLIIKPSLSLHFRMIWKTSALT